MTIAFSRFNPMTWVLLTLLVLIFSGAPATASLLIEPTQPEACCDRSAPCDEDGAGHCSEQSCPCSLPIYITAVGAPVLLVTTAPVIYPPATEQFFSSRDSSSLDQPPEPV